MNGDSSRKLRYILICNFFLNISIFAICTLQQRDQYSEASSMGGTKLFDNELASAVTHENVKDIGSLEEDQGIKLDILQPYKDHHGPKHRTHRQVRECQDVRYGNVTHSKLLSHGFHGNISLPIADTRHMIHVIQENYYLRRDVLMHFSVINNPFLTVSVLEPETDNGCEKDLRATVLESAKQEQCIVAINAGFFNTTSGACKGNLVSNGRIVHDTGGIQNAHFGITKDGYLFIGYLSEIDLVTQDFQQLVGGVLWLIRDGKSYLEESIKIECSDTEETGTLEYFASVMSARTVVGHDREGRVIFMQADGKTGDNGSVCQPTVRPRYSDRSASYQTVRHGYSDRSASYQAVRPRYSDRSASYRLHYYTNTVYWVSTLCCKDKACWEYKHDFERQDRSRFL